MNRFSYILLACIFGFNHRVEVYSSEFETAVRPLLSKYCVACHSGEEANGNVDFSAIATSDDVNRAFETWDAMRGHLRSATMPPKDEDQPNDEERNQFFDWYDNFYANVDTRPAVLKPRRLSVVEYRNTLESVFGFKLEVAIMEAEQTVAEKSLVVKLMPTDPPGESGFKNDTHRNPLTSNAWDQYSFLTDTAIEKLFSEDSRSELESFTGSIEDGHLTFEQVSRLLRKILNRTQRRPAPEERVMKSLVPLKGKAGTELVGALKLELKTALMAPEFLYRGLLMSGKPGERQPVDEFELAERLSYFLWADMPDARLMQLAEENQLSSSEVFAAEIERMLASSKARSLTDVFATEWLTLNEIEHVSDNVPKMVALKSQPSDFMHYLFTEDRPLLELIDSKTAFISPHTSGMYGRDSQQMVRYVKQRGIEVEIVANQKITLEATTERGGILTMPGVLAMNRGPVLRGTWILERILGEDLPEPPANVGQVPPNNNGENLSFRERFQMHRSNPTCAVCHDKIDPLGFALQNYGNDGQYLPESRKKNVKSNAPTAMRIDTSGRLPSGESFEDFVGLKRILVTSQRESVIRNIVERTMSYALCRKLTIYDRRTVDEIVANMNKNNGTWQDLFLAVASSVPFRETILSAR